MSTERESYEKGYALCVYCGCSRPASELRSQPQGGATELVCRDAVWCGRVQQMPQCRACGGRVVSMARGAKKRIHEECKALERKRKEAAR